MGFSLKGLITGLATSASEIMDEERKQTNALIAQRTKNSFDNYNKYQETTEALRADIKKRDSQLLNFQPDLTEEERIAAAGVPNLVDMYQQMLAQGKQVTVRDMIKVSDKAAGMKFENYVNEIGKIKPAETTTAAAPVSTKFFGPSAESQQKMADKAAVATGIPESELRSYERMPTTANVPSMGSIKTEVFKKAPKLPASVQEAADMANLERLNAKKQFGEDSEPYRMADAAFKLATSFLDSNVEDINKEALRLRGEIIDETDLAVKEKKIKRIAALEFNILEYKKSTSLKEPADKQKTFNQIKTRVDDFVATRMREDEGFDWKKYYDFKTYKMEDGSTYTSPTIKAGVLLPEQRILFAKEKELVKQALSAYGYLDKKTGVAMYTEISDFMISRGIPTNQSTSPAAEPAATRPATATPAATAARPIAAPAAAAAPIKVTAPNGQVLQFPNQAAADEFNKKLAGIK
jgi:ribosomal protein S18